MLSLRVSTCIVPRCHICKFIHDIANRWDSPILVPKGPELSTFGEICFLLWQQRMLVRPWYDSFCHSVSYGYWTSLLFCDPFSPFLPNRFLQNLCVSLVVMMAKWSGGSQGTTELQSSFPSAYRCDAWCSSHVQALEHPNCQTQHSWLSMIVRCWKPASEIFVHFWHFWKVCPQLLVDL